MFNIYERDYGIRTETDKELNTPDIENKTEARLLRGMTINKTDTEKKIDKLRKDINEDIEDIQEEVQGQNETINTLTEQVEQIPALIEQYLDQYVNSLEIASFNFPWYSNDKGARITERKSTNINRSDIVSVTAVSNNENVAITIAEISAGGTVTMTLNYLDNVLGSGHEGQLLVLYKGTTQTNS